MRDVHLAAVIIAWIQQTSALGKPECDGAVRTYCSPHNLTGIAVYAGRDIDGEYRTGALVHKIDHVPEQSVYLPDKAGAEHGIHDSVGPEDLGRDRIE